MIIARSLLASVVLLLAAYVVVMNWGGVIVSLRNKRRGIDRHLSTVPLVSVALAALAYLLYPRPDKMWLLSVPLADIGNWSLLWLPVVLIREALARKGGKSGSLERGRRQ